MNSITRRVGTVAAILVLVAYAAPAAADQVTLLSVQAGSSVVLNAAGLTRVAVGDGRIAGAIPVGTSQVLVNGKAPGHTTVVVWADGRRLTYAVTVTEQVLDDIAQMLRSAIQIKGVEVVTVEDHRVSGDLAATELRDQLVVIGDELGVRGTVGASPLLLFLHELSESHS